jgi:hypothetical protein
MHAHGRFSKCCCDVFACAPTFRQPERNCHVVAAVLCNPIPGNTVLIMVVVSGLDVTTTWIVSAWELRFNHVILSPWSRSFPELPGQVGVLGSQDVGASEYYGRRCAQMPRVTESALFHLYQWRSFPTDSRLILLLLLRPWAHRSVEYQRPVTIVSHGIQGAAKRGPSPRDRQRQRGTPSGGKTCHDRLVP